MFLYPWGYRGARLSLEEIANKPTVQMMDPEFRRRVLSMMDSAARSGVSLGIGGAGRNSAGQRALFLQRHEQVLIGGCCKLDGKRYRLKAGAAHAAPPGLSYHEPTTPDGKCLAADMVGNLRWMAGHCADFGLRDFSALGERWHIQPAGIPKGRSQYNSKLHHPLHRIELPDRPLPTPTLRLGSNGADVARLQDLLRANGHDPGRSDGKFGPRTLAAVKAFQLANGLPVDGVAGPSTWSALS